jgi:hypothetical protein
MRVEITLERVKITLSVQKSHSCLLKSHSSVWSEKNERVYANIFIKIDTLRVKITLCV